VVTGAAQSSASARLALLLPRLGEAGEGTGLLSACQRWQRACAPGRSSAFCCWLLLSFPLLSPVSLVSASEKHDEILATALSSLSSQCLCKQRLDITISNTRTSKSCQISPPLQVKILSCFQALQFFFSPSFSIANKRLKRFLQVSRSHGARQADMSSI